MLDSFLGSATTTAVAHKMCRQYIGVEMGDHAYSLCKPRLDSVISGTDNSGITKAVGWQGGGGYRFYELAPTLINKDPFDEYVINEDYDADMLAAAVALHEGFTYQPDGNLFWKQSVGNENSYLFVTTRHLTAAYLDSVKSTMEDGEYLIIACRSFDAGLDKVYDNITVKKIPQTLSIPRMTGQSLSEQYRKRKLHSRLPTYPRNGNGWLPPKSGPGNWKS